MIFFVTKYDGLNKAHVQHLEARLHELAKAAKQCRLENVQCLTPPTLSEADRADTQSFLEDVLSILPLVGIGAFETFTSAAVRDKPLFYVTGKEVKATGYEDARGFIICKGLGACGDETPSMQELLQRLRRNQRPSLAGLERLDGIPEATGPETARRSSKAKPSPDTGIHCPYSCWIAQAG